MHPVRTAPGTTMHMTIRARIIDITPILLVFAFVAAFATVVIVEYVVNQPMPVPASRAAEVPREHAPDLRTS